jgi:hypothetical protein
MDQADRGLAFDGHDSQLAAVVGDTTSGFLATLTVGV